MPLVQPPSYPTPEEIRQVLSTCQSRSRHNFLGIRDEAIIRIFATTGARLSEVAELRVQDVDLDTAYPQVTVLGKGRRTRDLPLDERTADAVRRYVKVAARHPRHPTAATEWLWLARAGRMTASGIAQMTSERGKAVGVELHAHAFRHYAIDQMLRSGMSEGDTIGKRPSIPLNDGPLCGRKAGRASPPGFPPGGQSQPLGGLTQILEIAPNDFTHLHVHSEFSLLDGLGRIDDLVLAGQRTGLRQPGHH